MQNKTVHQLQNALDKTIKAVKFYWRHFFVFCVVGITINGVVSGKIPHIDKLAIILAAAFLVDWIKTKIKFSGVNNSQDRYHQAAAESFRRYSEWATNPAKIGSPTHHIYNLGYNTGKYY